MSRSPKLYKELSNSISPSDSSLLCVYAYSIYSGSPDQNPEDLFYVPLAGDVPPKLRAYARYMTSSSMTLRQKNSCNMDAAAFAKMLMGVCATCTSLCPWLHAFVAYAMDSA